MYNKRFTKMCKYMLKAYVMGIHKGKGYKGLNKHLQARYQNFRMLLIIRILTCLRLPKDPLYFL